VADCHLCAFDVVTATIAAQNGNNPGQTPAPVPPDADTGWSAPDSTTNRYTTTLKGP